MQSASFRAKALARKKGFGRIGFRRKNPLGKLYYSNPYAVPVRSGSYFDKRNIESLYVRGFVSQPWNHEDLHGSSGAIAWGKIKFKGLPKPKTVAIKGYFKPGEGFEAELSAIVERLKRSKAKHPKMCVFPLEIERKRNLYLLMEPFIKTSREGMVVSKFEPYERVVNQIKLSVPADQKVFRKVLVEAAELAKVGLAVPYSFGVARDFIELGLPPEALKKIAHKQIDVFNKITLKNGETQIFAQDIDELQIVSSRTKAWKQSVKNISEVVLENNLSPDARGVVRAIVLEVEKAHGFR
ncbi:Uncharacterised protein [uncultured archaeon]|nr:Uncharacterised protein [uncultured archaeon]